MEISELKDALPPILLSFGAVVPVLIGKPPFSVREKGVGLTVLTLTVLTFLNHMGNIRWYRRPRTDYADMRLTHSGSTVILTESTLERIFSSSVDAAGVLGESLREIVSSIRNGFP